MATRNGGFPAVQGAMVGAIAFVVGLLVTVLVGSFGLNPTIELLVSFSLIDGSIWGYTAFHQWLMVIGNGALDTFLVWAIVPIAILVVSGYWIASQAPRGQGFMNGASVTVGYFVMTVLAFLYLAFLVGNAQATIEVGVDLVIATVITGILFPVVFGGIGGILADSL